MQVNFRMRGQKFLDALQDVRAVVGWLQDEFEVVDWVRVDTPRHEDAGDGYVLSDCPAQVTLGFLEVLAGGQDIIDQDDPFTQRRRLEARHVHFQHGA